MIMAVESNNGLLMQLLLRDAEWKATWAFIDDGIILSEPEDYFERERAKRLARLSLWIMPMIMVLLLIVLPCVIGGIYNLGDVYWRFVSCLVLVAVFGGIPVIAFIAVEDMARTDYLNSVVDWLYKLHTKYVYTAWVNHYRGSKWYFWLSQENRRKVDAKLSPIILAWHRDRWDSTIEAALDYISEHGVKHNESYESVFEDGLGWVRVYRNKNNTIINKMYDDRPIAYDDLRKWLTDDNTSYKHDERMSTCEHHAFQLTDWDNIILPAIQAKNRIVELTMLTRDPE